MKAPAAGAGKLTPHPEVVGGAILDVFRTLCMEPTPDTREVFRELQHLGA
jgi:hypothetical protein